MTEVALSGTLELGFRVLSDDMDRAFVIDYADDPVFREMDSS